MHLGMSGSFRVAAGGGRDDAGRLPSSARGRARARPCRLPHVVGRAHHLQRSAPLRLDAAGAARRARRPSADAGGRAGAARQRIRRRPAGARLPRQEGRPQGGADGPEGRRRPRQHLCLRGAAPRAALAQARRRDASRRRRARRTSAPSALVDAIQAVLAEAIEAGGSSLRDHRQTDGELGYFQHHFRVYDREGERCVTPGCGGTVKRIVQGGRSTFYCPVCQK